MNRVIVLIRGNKTDAQRYIKQQAIYRKVTLRYGIDVFCTSQAPSAMRGYAADIVRVLEVRYVGDEVYNFIPGSRTLLSDAWNEMIEVVLATGRFGHA